MPEHDGRRVLVVEDESLVALMAEDLLTDLGFVVAASVGTVADALTAVASESFDVALLDVNLNEERVFPVADELRRRAIPFVFATGYGPNGVREDLRSAPVLTKPYRRPDLERALRRAFGL